jgi:hypothetical protein
LAAVVRAHAPLDPAEVLQTGDVTHEVQRLWAARLGVAAADLVLAGSDAEATRLVLQALLAPGDVLLLAEPVAHDVPGAVLTTGAAYVDLGRLHDGALDPAALATARARHPDAVLWLHAPGLFGEVDAWPVNGSHASKDSLPRAVLVDARLQPGWHAGPVLPAGVLAALVALRDPDEPEAPVLHAVVCAPGTGADLQLLQGPVNWPPVLMQQALAILRGLDAEPTWPAAADAQMTFAYQVLADALAHRPGVRLQPAAGVWAAAECLAGDAAEVARALVQIVGPVQAFAAHPLRSLVVVRLAGAHVLATPTRELPPAPAP